VRGVQAVHLPVAYRAGTGVLEVRELSGEGESFTCANCKKACVKGRSDEDAAAEAISLFPADHLLAEKPGIVCDPCFKMIMEWAKVNAPELLL
jgi:hypothetical protein